MAAEIGPLPAYFGLGIVAKAGYIYSGGETDAHLGNVGLNLIGGNAT